MKKILVPVDFSDTALNALQIACQLAVRSGASILMVHINEMAVYLVPVSELSYNTSALEIDQYSKDTQSRLDEIRAGLLQQNRFSNLHIETMVIEGLMISAVNDLMETTPIDLVVMGTLGVSGWKEMFVGSNTERMIRFAPCPVLVIPDGVDELEIKKVVIPTNLKSDQMPVFQLAKTWQDIFGFDVDALYLNDPLGALTHFDIDAEKNKQMEAAGLLHVYLHLYGMTVDAEAAIRQYAQGAAANLIIMGTHQPRGLSHVLFGSLTEDTANHSVVPVLAVPLGNSVSTVSGE